MIDIYVLRHGAAQPRAPGLAEADRKLTKQGRHEVARVMRRARESEVKIELVLTSPYRRAAQTASIAIERFRPTPRVEETPALLPEANPERVWQEIRAHTDTRAFMVVGHEPQLSRLVAYLLGTPALRMDLKKGALVRIRLESTAAAPHGELKWLLTPRLAHEA